jgi:hypothetical protein
VEQIVASYFSVKIRFVLQTFRSRAGAEVVVPRQAGIARKMRGAIPHLIVLAGKAVASFEEVAILSSVSLFGLIHGHNHRGQKGRLGASEEVSTVGVQDRSVVLELEEEVLHHASGKRDALVPQSNPE